MSRAEHSEKPMHINWADSTTAEAEVERLAVAFTKALGALPKQPPDEIRRLDALLLGVEDALRLHYSS